MEPRIEVLEADITTLDVDAIVNAANESLLGGGGVDGAIHRAAGAALLAACRELPELQPGVRCPTGEARLTPAFRLHARFVIHAVGPVWRGGEHAEAELLASSYRSALTLAAEREVGDIAFPAISCGVYGYPIEQAVPVAVREVHAWLTASAAPQRVIFCAFGRTMAEAYRAELARTAAA